MVKHNGQTFKNIAQIPIMGQTKSGKVPHQKIVVNGIEFDSKVEHDRYLELLVMEKAGVVRRPKSKSVDLNLQMEVKKRKPIVLKALCNMEIQ